MGITHYFPWHIKTFKNTINSLLKGEDFKKQNIVIDNLMIDLNGVFHASTQKIYEYGTHKPRVSLLRTQNTKKNIGSFKTQIKVFEDICKTIEKILVIVNPKKRLILCVDGTAPLSKQNQQRQRRFRAALDKSDEEFTKFDSNCLTPGTKFMDYLTCYIDWFIRKSISTNELWMNIEVVFSSEKIPGEGEHKLINYMRSIGDINENYCMHGLDADLIMLALGTHLPNFWILREDLYSTTNEFYILNIGKAREELSILMNWGVECDKKECNIFNPVYAINDFIFMCFMVGNDFLPHVKSLEIIEGGIDHMIDIYKKVGKSYGHLTINVSNSDKEIVFQKKPLEMFFRSISNSDKEILEKKMIKKHLFFPDELLEKHCLFNNETKTFNLDMENYRKDYYENKFKDIDIKDLCHQYLVGLQWVLSYYTKGVPDWKWCFKHHYAPFAYEIAEYIYDFNHPIKKQTFPSTPFQQLLSVLPPKSSTLIPAPLSYLLSHSTSELKKFCPDKFDTDLSGKRKEWQGVVLLPMVDFDIITIEYFKNIGKVHKSELGRNIIGDTLVYSLSDTSCVYVSEYGNIQECKVNTRKINL
jgi:5'-3' exonuclease